MGIGFQLKDDLLDVYGDPAKFGKQVGGDIIANKKTFLLITALEKANSNQRKEMITWLNAKKFNKKEKVTAIRALYDTLDIASHTEHKINQYFKKGFKQLEKVNGNASGKEALKNFAIELISRQS